MAVDKVGWAGMGLGWAWMTSVLLYLVLYLVIDLNSFDVVVVVLDKFEMIRLLFIVYVTVNGKKEKCA